MQMLTEPSFILESTMVRAVNYMVILDIKALLNVAQLIKFILKIQITQFQYSVPFPSTTLVPQTTSYRLEGPTFYLQMPKIQPYVFLSLAGKVKVISLAPENHYFYWNGKIQILVHADDFPTVMEPDFYLSPGNVIAGWQRKETWCFRWGQGRKKQTLVLACNFGRM